MLHLFQNDFTFSPSLYSVALCDNIGFVLLILRLAMLFCHSSYCTMCIIHPDLDSFTFYTIPISPLCNLKNFSFTCVYRDGNGLFCIRAIHKEICFHVQFQFNRTLRTSRWRTCEKVTPCKKMDENTGKHDFLKFAMFFIFFF